MKKLSRIVAKLILTLVFMSVYTTLMAQKVQSVQEGSIWAPATVKIDGKLTEWGTTLSAFNKNVKLWYTIANDEKNIYLAIKSTDLDNNNKILAGGISFTLNTDDKKKSKNAFIITFPIINRSGVRTGRGGGGGRRGGGFGKDDTQDTAAIAAQQKQTLATSKEISAIGFAAITDTLISIYNEYSIKAVASVDNKGVLVYELAIPIKLLNIAAGSQKELAYNIKLNGLTLNVGMNISAGNLSISGGGGGFGNGGGGGGFGGGRGSDISDMMSPTDFWGKYTLAIKPSN